LVWTSEFGNKKRAFPGNSRTSIPDCFILYVFCSFSSDSFFFLFMNEGHVNDRRPFVCVCVCVMFFVPTLVFQLWAKDTLTIAGLPFAPDFVIVEA
jgi:hypothetical protein